jgi:hypothetical protein
MRTMGQDYLKVRMHHTGSAGVKIVTSDLRIFDAAHFMRPPDIKIRQLKGVRKNTRRKLVEFKIMLLGDGDDRGVLLVGKEVKRVALGGLLDKINREF